MATGWVYHDDFLRHDTGPAHPERPERLTAIVQALQQANLLAQLQPLAFAPVGPEVLSLIHEQSYVELVRVACQEEMSFIGTSETRICPRSYDIARLAVGGVLAACDAVINRQVKRAFCAVRPPGHHAERDLAMGFCLFNNVALAAEHLIRKHGLERLAIVDFDVHHGNGTQHAFEARDDVLYISLHEHPAFLFPGTGFASERGTGRGQGFTLNIPLPPGSTDIAYHRAFAEKVLPALESYKPQFLLLSAGFDALRQDAIAHLNLEPESFAWMSRDLVAAAEAHCAGRLVSVLEGGYHLEGTGQSAVAHVRAML